MKFTKVSTVLLMVLLAISSFFIISLITHITPDISDRDMNKWINFLLVWTYVLLAISCISLLLLELAHVISDKRMKRKSLVFIGTSGGVFFVSYLLSDSKLPQFQGVDKYIADGTLTPTISHCIEACLFTSYILIALALLGIAYSYIYQLFN